MKTITLLTSVRVGLALITLGAAASCTCTSRRQVLIAPATTADELTVDLGNAITMQFVRIPAGSFTMGSRTGGAAEQPAHTVTFAKPFYMSRYLVTQAQWRQIMNEDRGYYKGSTEPVNNLNWNMAQDLIARLNYAVPRLKFSLPTEAQYEYACRAGSTGEYCFGDDVRKLPEYGWFKANSGYRQQPVGQKKPNAWGLYDMHGDVYVWCQDVWQKTYDGAPIDGSARTDGQLDYRVIRGGAWCYDASYLRSARRSFIKPDPHGPLIGLRLVLMVAPPTYNFGPGYCARPITDRK